MFTVTRFANCGEIYRAVWCAYSEERFAARFVICGAICDSHAVHGATNREGAYNVAASTKRSDLQHADGAYNKSGAVRSAAQ